MKDVETRMELIVHLMAIGEYPFRRQGHKSSSSWRQMYWSKWVSSEKHFKQFLKYRPKDNWE